MNRLHCLWITRRIAVMRRKNPGIADDVTSVNSRITSGNGSFRVSLTSEDGTRLSAELCTGPDHDLGFVLGHGFTNHVRKPAVRRVARRLATHATTLAVDFRGHGRSGGRSTVGVTETQDLAAAVGYLRELGCRGIVTIGFSLGAAVAIRHAALAAPEQRPEAVIAVSSPVRWWTRDSPAMRRVHWLLEQPPGRWSARALGVRLAPPWTDIPLSPVEAAGFLPPTPLLVVHGAEDHYFAAAEAHVLAEAGQGQLWLEPEMRHAEGATTPELVDRIARWAADRVTMPRVRARPNRRTVR